MSTLLRLIKFNISYHLKPRFDSKKDRNKFIAMCTCMLIGLLMPLAMVIAFVYMSTGMAVQMGIVPEFLSVLLFMAEVNVFVLGITTYIDIVYFSKDNIILASMPIKTTHIYISKLIVCIISMLLLSALITIPSIIASAVALVNAGVTLGASYYLVGILAIFVVPVVPMMLVSILSFPIMKLVAYLKRKPVLMSVVTVLFVICSMVAIWLIMFFMMPGDGVSMNMIKSIADIGKFSYSTLVITRAMMGVDIGVNIAILAGIVVGSLLLNVGLSVLLYKNTIARLGEGGGVKSSTLKVKETKHESVKMSLIKREMRMVLRSPDLFVQSLLMIVLGPILIVVFSLFQGGNKESDGGLFMTAMVFFYISIIMGLNYLSTIAISRERETISLLKSLPIDPKTVLYIKLLLADIVTLIGTTLCSIVYVCVANVPWYFFFLMLMFTSFNAWSLNCYGLMRDVKKPNFKWINAKEITKNNFGAIIPMLISMIPGFVVTIVVGGVSALKLPYFIPALIEWSIIGVSSIVFFFVFRWRKLDKMVALYERIEP